MAAEKETVQKSFTLPKDVADKLDAAVEERMIGASLIASKGIEKFLESLPPLPGTEKARPEPSTPPPNPSAK